MRKVLLAIGEEHYSNILRKNLIHKGQDIEILQDEVYRLEYIEEAVEQFQPDMLIVHDYYLTNGFDDERTRQLHLVDLFRQYREKYDDQLRIVYLCERSTSDPFLSELVSVNVLDIFHKQNIGVDDLMNQLNGPAKYSNVTKFNSKPIEQEEKHDKSFDSDSVESEEDEEAVVEVKSNPLLERLAASRPTQEKPQYLTIKNQWIAFASLWPQAGSTTLAMNVARGIAKRDVDVTYIEYPTIQPYMFDYLQFHVQENERGPFDDKRTRLHSDKQQLQPSLWEDKGVHWHVLDPREDPLHSIQYESLVRYTYPYQSTVNILDVSHQLNDKGLLDFMTHLHKLYICLEPNPIKLNWRTPFDSTKTYREWLYELVEQFPEQIEIVTVKHSKQVNVKDWKSMIPKRPQMWLSDISNDDLIKTLWQGTFLYDQSNYQTMFEDVMKPIAETVLPKPLQVLEKKTSLLSRLKRA